MDSSIISAEGSKKKCIVLTQGMKMLPSKTTNKLSVETVIGSNNGIAMGRSCGVMG